MEMSKLSFILDCLFLGDIPDCDVPCVERESYEQKIVHGLAKGYGAFISEHRHPMKMLEGSEEDLL